MYVDSFRKVYLKLYKNYIVEKSWESALQIKWGVVCKLKSKLHRLTKGTGGRATCTHQGRPLVNRGHRRCWPVLHLTCSLHICEKVNFCLFLDHLGKTYLKIQVQEFPEHSAQTSRRCLDFMLRQCFSYWPFCTNRGNILFVFMNMKCRSSNKGSASPKIANFNKLTRTLGTEAVISVLHAQSAGVLICMAGNMAVLICHLRPEPDLNQVQINKRIKIKWIVSLRFVSITSQC